MAWGWQCAKPLSNPPGVEAGIQQKNQVNPIAAECWCHGSLRHQVISSHDIDFIAKRVKNYIDGLMQERRKSIANALKLCLSCTNPSTCKLSVYYLDCNCMLSVVITLHLSASCSSAWVNPVFCQLSDGWIVSWAGVWGKGKLHSSSVGKGLTWVGHLLWWNISLSSEHTFIVALITKKPVGCRPPDSIQTKSCQYDGCRWPGAIICLMALMQF